MDGMFKEVFSMRFNCLRFVGVLALGVTAVFLVAMLHYDPGYLFQEILNTRATVLSAFIVSLIIAAFLLSTEFEKKGSE